MDSAAVMVEKSSTEVDVLQVDAIVMPSSEDSVLISPFYQRNSREVPASTKDSSSSISQERSDLQIYDCEEEHSSPRLIISRKPNVLFLFNYNIH